MMRQYELVESVLKYNPHANEDLLNKAYVYAMKAHGNQKRASGDLFFSHPLEVAAILTDLKLDDATIVTALLHDTIEDTGVTKKEISSTFGPEIASLVDGLTKIKKLDLVTREAKQAENFRKLLIAITSDIRVLLVKLADRLHNMRTIQYMKPASRERISKETMEIYAPLAGRMGMQWLRDDLEDLAFQALNPEAYQNLTTQLDEMRLRSQEFIDTISGELEDNLKRAGIKAEIHGREKKPYSIWRKIERRKVAFEQLSDVFGFRVVVGNLTDCYKALGVIHTHWHVVPGRFKDYISNPKQNDYQSLHTTIVGPQHQRVELQIRTHHMHHIAEYGVAAHTLYKDGIEIGANHSMNNPEEAMILSQESKAYRWLRQLVEMLLEGDNSEEFLEHTKLELFQDQVFCFTPKGALVALPVGAVPIDFAYAVHTDVGNNCVGCKVNGHHVPLVSKLKNGDEVEIIVSKAQTPPPAWEAIAVTGKARSAIRRATRNAIREQYSELGRQILIRVFSEIEKDYSDELIEKVLPRFIHQTVPDILSAVGRGELSSRDILIAAFPEIEPKSFQKRRKIQRNEDGWLNLSSAIGLKFRDPNRDGKLNGKMNGIPIRGHQSDVPVSFAEGGAVPGDRIVGILTTGKGITIYPIHSSKLADFDNQPERWIDLTWDIDETTVERFPAQINVTGINEPGTLAEITQLIGETDGNIDKLQIETRTNDFAEMLIDVEVWDLKHLNDIINGLRSVSVVSDATRHYQ